ncbi:MAG: PilN domain-containing protein, partial [Proteobacteria bacterium]|nr:PilN domain-containing protein [Pseudomonadota bacterium]
ALADAGDGGPPLLLWEPERADARRAPKRLLRTLEIAAAALLLAAYGLHLYRLESERGRLQAELQAESRRAAEARALGQQLARSSEALGVLRGMLEQPSPLQILNDLTALMPLDSWVSDLTIRGRSVEIVGQAPRAADLVATIEASPMFGKARFRSPITLLPDGHVERFDMTLEVKDRAK